MIMQLTMLDRPYASHALLMRLAVVGLRKSHSSSAQSRYARSQLTSSKRPSSRFDLSPSPTPADLRLLILTNRIRPSSNNLRASERRHDHVLFRVPRPLCDSHIPDLGRSAPLSFHRALPAHPDRGLGLWCVVSRVILTGPRRPATAYAGTHGMLYSTKIKARQTEE